MIFHNLCNIVHKRGNKLVEFFKEKAFTLAEIMVALVVIGVITSILLPVAFNNLPNENVMKFKKGHATLFRVINELVTSDKYYGNDLGYKPDGTNIGTEKNSDIVYFCNTFADILTTKSVNCSMQQNPGGHISYDWLVNKIGFISTGLDTIPEILDYYCKINSSKINPEIITSDNIIYYQTSPKETFGAFTNFKYDTPGNKYLFRAMWNGTDGAICEDDGAGSFVCDKTTDGSQEGGWYYYVKEDGTALHAGTTPVGKFYHIYKVFCMDIDDMQDGEDPFGYGIRIDGKIIAGARAQEWLNKNIQDKE